MQLTRVHSTSAVCCATCGNMTVPAAVEVYADLSARPFAYHHGGCIPADQLVDGIRRHQAAMDASAAAYYRAHEGRYQGD